MQPHEVAPATALSRPLRPFRTHFDTFALAGWKRTLVPICRYKKHENRAWCLEPVQKPSKRKKRKLKDENLFDENEKNKPKRFKRISKSKNC